MPSLAGNRLFQPVVLVRADACARLSCIAVAASFVPPNTGSAVRLVNLAVDVPAAGLLDGKGVSLADNVKYTLGSKWAPISATEQTFSAVADARAGHSRSLTVGRLGHELAGVLASSPFTPPQSPQVFTTFLLGSKRFGYSLLPQVDAPESGPCKPSAPEPSQAVKARVQSVPELPRVATATEH